MIHVVLTGGGTGGHTFPLLAVSRKLRQMHGRAEVRLNYIGPKSPMMKKEKEIFQKEDIPAHFVSAGKMRRYLAVKNFTDPFVTIWGILQSLVLLLRLMPDVVFAKGGYGALPVVIAAWLYRIPILIHESDAVPGIANRIMGKLSRRIALAYPRAREYFVQSKTALVGIPVREEVLRGDRRRARQKFRLRSDLPTVLFLGGSQGAQALNRAVISALKELTVRVQVIHQTGEANYKWVKAAAAREGFKTGRDKYCAVDFLDDEGMADALAVADVVVSRAGAGAIAEIAAYRKALILVPLDLSANDHQRMNAYELAKVGGALVLEEANLGHGMLTSKIFKILDDAQLRTSMEKKIAVFYHPDAAETIARGLLELTQ